jgi:hypothetical protein
LHSPSLWSKFLRSIIGVPSFNTILWFGTPEHLKELRNSVVTTSKA